MTDDDVCKTAYMGKRSKCETKLGGEAYKAEGSGRDSSTRQQECQYRRCLRALAVTPV